ncbi:glycosyltransferase family 9 protein [Pigmentibacter ruber]
MNFDNKAETKKILIMLPRQLGDVLLATPIATELRKHFPAAEIHWWSHPMAKEILNDNSFLNKVYYLPIWIKKKYKKTFFLKKFFLWLGYIFAELKLFFKLMFTGYDIVIDAINYPRSSLQAMATFAPIRISFKCNSVRDFAYNNLVDRTKLDEGYLGYTRLLLLEPLGIKISNINPLQIKLNLPILSENKIKPELWIKEQLEKLNAKKFVVMSPTSRYLDRCWPINHYTELAFLIIREFNIPVVWSRAPGEEEYILKVHHNLIAKLQYNNIQENYSLLPPLMSIREITYLTSLSVGCVANSNGMSHFAVASGTKMIQLHGPTVPLNWIPPDTNKYLGIQKNTGCYGCSSNVCKMPRHECMEDILPIDVFKKAVELFGLKKE